MITVATGNFETIRTTAATLEIQNCLILYTPSKGMLEYANQAKALLDSLNVENLPVETKIAKIEFDFDQDVTNQVEFRRNLASAFHQAIGEFSSNCAAENLAIDLTPGFLTIKTVMLETVSRTGNLFVYLKHSWQGRNVKYGSEELVIWRKGESWLESRPT